jgi:HEAT repeat protein
MCVSAVAVGLWSRAVAQDQPALASPAAGSQTVALLKTIADPQASQGDREAAALKLVGSRDDSIRPELVAALKQDSDPGGQLAVAKALGEIAWPHPDFIEPLFGLIANRNGQSVRVKAAAAALAQYGGNLNVLQRLITTADSNEGDEIRIPIIMAIGSFNQKLAAQTLIDLQQRADSDAVERAAGDALIEMTGLDDYGHSAGAWQKWWLQNQGLSDDAFQAQVSQTRSDAFEREVTKRAIL